MSRVGKEPVTLPKGVEFSQKGRLVTIKGGKESLSLELHPNVEVALEGDQLQVSPAGGGRLGMAMTGTMRSLLNNMAVGVTDGFERKLNLVGVGYRAKCSGNKLELSLGFSHPVVYAAPEGITLDAPSQTEITVKGADKQRVGQTAAEIRAFRPPEPYKGKGVRYVGEHVAMKEAKKKK